MACSCIHPFIVNPYLATKIWGGDDAEVATSMELNMFQVFIVHGHDEEAKTKTEVNTEFSQLRNCLIKRN